MNIQPSIIVWTIICFVLLMLVLNNLLFKPVLEVIDKRRKRVESARKKRAEREQIAKENEENRVLAEKQSARLSEELVKAEAEKIQQDGKKKIQKAQKERLLKVNKYREQMKIEHEAIVSQVSPEMEKTAKLFADVLLSDRV